MGKLFEKSFPQPLQKTFYLGYNGYRLCNSGASNEVLQTSSFTNHQKTFRDFFTSAQWKVNAVAVRKIPGREEGDHAFFIPSGTSISPTPSATSGTSLKREAKLYPAIAPRRGQIREFRKPMHWLSETHGSRSRTILSGNGSFKLVSTWTYTNSTHHSFPL